MPEDFVKHFGHLRSAEVVYQGLLNQERIEDVRTGKYPGHEGVVAKGVRSAKVTIPNMDSGWQKIKTKRWLEELKQRAKTSEDFRKVMADNLAEQDHSSN